MSDRAYGIHVHADQRDDLTDGMVPAFDAETGHARWAAPGGDAGSELIGVVTGDRNSQQRVIVGRWCDAGEFRISFDGEEATSEIYLPASNLPGQVLGKLRSLPSLDATNVRVNEHTGLIEFFGDRAGQAQPLIEITDVVLRAQQLSSDAPIASDVLNNIATWAPETEFGVAWGNQVGNYDIVAFVKRPSDGSVWASEYGGQGSGNVTGTDEPDWDAFDPENPTVAVNDGSYGWYPVADDFPTIGGWEPGVPMTPTRLIRAGGMILASMPDYPSLTGDSEPTWVSDGIVTSGDYYGENNGYWWPVGFAGIEAEEIYAGGSGERSIPLAPNYYASSFAEDPAQAVGFTDDAGALWAAFGGTGMALLARAYGAWYPLNTLVTGGLNFTGAADSAQRVGVTLNWDPFADGDPSTMPRLMSDQVSPRVGHPRTALFELAFEAEAVSGNVRANLQIDGAVIGNANFDVTLLDAAYIKAQCEDVLGVDTVNVVEVGTQRWTMEYVGPVDDKSNVVFYITEFGTAVTPAEATPYIQTVRVGVPDGIPAPRGSILLQFNANDTTSFGLWQKAGPLATDWSLMHRLPIGWTQPVYSEDPADLAAALVAAGLMAAEV